MTPIRTHLLLYQSPKDNTYHACMTCLAWGAVRGTGLVKPAARSRDSDFPTCATDSLTPYN